MVPSQEGGHNELTQQIHTFPQISTNGNIQKILVKYQHLLYNQGPDSGLKLAIDQQEVLKCLRAQAPEHNYGLSLAKSNPGLCAHGRLT